MYQHISQSPGSIALCALALMCGGASAFGDEPLEITHSALGTAATLTGDGGLSLTGTIGQPAGVQGNADTTLTSSLLDEFSNPCPADFNRDGLADFFDYLDFVDAFSNGAQEADFNSDTVIDFFDYLDFVDAFSIGC